MTKKRIRQVIDIERTGLGEQNHIEWYEEKEVDDQDGAVEKQDKKGN